MDADARRIALQMLAAEPILEDRRLLDDVAAPFTLTRFQDETLVGAVLDKMQAVLPDGIDQLVRRLAGEEDAGLLDPGTGFALTVYPLRAADGEIWVAVGGGRVVSDDDEQPSDGQLDEGSLEATNLLNLSSPGIYWHSGKGVFAALAGGAVPLRELNTSWLQVTIEMVVRAAGRADEILENDSPLLEVPACGSDAGLDDARIQRGSCRPGGSPIRRKSASQAPPVHLVSEVGKCSGTDFSIQKHQ